MTGSATTRMPVLFLGHGSPMNAIEDNAWSRAFRELAKELPKPRAILAVSAHWFGPGVLLTAQERPPTIHDFGGFPRELYEVQYPAPGDPELAERVARSLASEDATLSDEWGLDHGTWSVLRHLAPEADCPVVQLSLDARLAPERHLELGRALAPLRDEGVLVLGSGNLVHNLRDAFQRQRSGDASVPEWAQRFDAEAAEAIQMRDGDFLARCVESDLGRLAQPTLDHYLPLLYVVGAAGERDAVRFPIEGFDGSLSMRAVRFG